MTAELDPPVHWYLMTSSDHVVYARSEDLVVYGNQAVISRVTESNWGTYYASDDRGRVDVFQVRGLLWKRDSVLRYKVALESVYLLYHVKNHS